MRLRNLWLIPVFAAGEFPHPFVLVDKYNIEEMSKQRIARVGVRNRTGMVNKKTKAWYNFVQYVNN